MQSKYTAMLGGIFWQLFDGSGVKDLRLTEKRCTLKVGKTDERDFRSSWPARTDVTVFYAKAEAIFRSFKFEINRILASPLLACPSFAAGTAFVTWPLQVYGAHMVFFFTPSKIKPKQKNKCSGAWRKNVASTNSANTLFGVAPRE